MPRWTLLNKTGTLTSHGYRQITDEAGNQVYEHRYVMEKHLGRKLLKGEAVHHIDGNKLHNEIFNLFLTTTGGHISLEHANGIYREHMEKLHGFVDRRPKKCEWCGKSYFKIRRHKTRRFCGAKCKNSWLSHYWLIDNPKHRR